MNYNIKEIVKNKNPCTFQNFRKGHLWYKTDCGFEFPVPVNAEEIGDAIFNSEEKISALGFKKSSTRLLPSNTVLMAMYGATAAQLAILKVESTTNQACCAMICKNTQDSAYLYYRLLSEQSEIKRQAIGGAQENLSKALIEKLPIFSSNSINQITDTFEKLINYKAELTKKIMMLEEASNLLLSKIAVSK